MKKVSLRRVRKLQ